MAVANLGHPCVTRARACLSAPRWGTRPGQDDPHPPRGIMALVAPGPPAHQWAADAAPAPPHPHAAATTATIHHQRPAAQLLLSRKQSPARHGRFGDPPRGGPLVHGAVGVRSLREWGEIQRGVDPPGAHRGRGRRAHDLRRENIEKKKKNQ